MFLRAVGLLVALLLSSVAGMPPPPSFWPLNMTAEWFECNNPGTEQTFEQYGQTVRSFRHCLNEDQIFKNSMCAREINPQAIRVRCMNNTAFPLPSFQDFDWWDTRCHDDEVCVDDTGVKTWPFKHSDRGSLDSIARCVKPADTAVVWSTNGAPGKHRARWNMVGPDVNYTRLDYIVTVHFLEDDFRTNAKMMHPDFRILDHRGLALKIHDLIRPLDLRYWWYIGYDRLWKGWRQFEVEFQHAPKSYGCAFTIIDKYAA